MTTHPAPPVVDEYLLRTIADAAASLDKRGDRAMTVRLMKLHAALTQPSQPGGEEGA